jgi:hypothetical protein
MMAWIIPITWMTSGFRHAAARSLMRLAEQAQFLAHGCRGISDLVDRALKFVFGHAKMPGPVLNLMRLVHGNMAAVTLALVEEIVAHIQVLGRERPRLGEEARPFAASPHSRLGGKRQSFAVSLVMHEQRENENDRKRNSD